MSADEPAQPGVLFTAFEPSGDDHAAAVIAELRRREPTLPIFAWGGPKMAAAGATIIAQTGAKAVMGLPGMSKILEHGRVNSRIASWLKHPPSPIALHVPVDSPAANFPICKIARRSGLKVIHLVAPQVWAWGSWRIKKLRRLTDLVLCLLPFEEDWFRSRAVPAKFIGHPLFDQPLDTEELDRRSAGFPSGSPRLALMPGSRPAELESSWPILLDAFRRLRADFPATVGVVAATTPGVAEGLRRRAEELGGWPEGLHVASGETDAVIRWCEYALVVSGTVTLQIAKQLKPMVTFYRPSQWGYHLVGRWLVSTELFTLPNLIAGRRIMLELVPHFGSGEELAIEVIRLMRQPGYAEAQRQELGAVVRKFEGHNAARSAAEQILEALGASPPAAPEIIRPASAAAPQA